MNTHLIILLDRSGSMASGRDQTLKGLNDFFTQQKKLVDDSVATLITFSVTSTTIFEKQLIRNIQECKEYTPDGGTALYDTLGNVLAKYSDEKEEHIVVIVTDGIDNESTVYTHSHIRQLISARTNDGWKFIYLSNDLSALDEGLSMGVTNHIQTPSRGLSQGFMSGLTQSVSSIRESSHRLKNLTS
jgi:hypothetical protein